MLSRKTISSSAIDQQDGLQQVVLPLSAKYRDISGKYGGVLDVIKSVQLK